MKTLFGVPSSPGIGIGTVHKLNPDAHEIPLKAIPADRVEREIARFEQAVARTKRSLVQIEKRIHRQLGPEQANIFSAHIIILEDIALKDETIKIIRERLLSAPSALKVVSENAVKVFGNMHDKFLAERVLDIQDVYQRLIAHLLNRRGPGDRWMQKGEARTVVAHHLTPSDMAHMDNQSVTGCAVEMGGRTSHVSLIAQSLEIPCVVGCGEILDSVEEGETIIVDGSRGIVICKPDEKTLSRYQMLQRRYQRNYYDLQRLADLSAVTLDGKAMELAANIELPLEVESLKEHGVRSVGLYRTEFLYMTRQHLPSEEEQFRAYRYIARRLYPNYAVIRTLDAGGDKMAPFLKIGEERNPFLGYRSIRICLEETKMFKSQIRAILRASAFGRIKILFPMISQMEELKEVLRIFRNVRASLRRQAVKFDPSMEVGIMIEVPSAALMADDLAKEVDFFSIGTNDLIQFLLAVDRGNKKIANLYDAFNPSVLRTIHNVIQAAHRNKIWAGCCGEMAANPLAVPLLMGMGIDELSMSPLSVLNIKKFIRRSAFEKMRLAARRSLRLQSSEQIKTMLREEFREELKGVMIKWEPNYKGHLHEIQKH